MYFICLFVHVLKGLTEQALSHATRGRDILPTCHVTTETTPPEPMYNLALAHYIIGVAQAAKKKYIH